VGDGGRGTGGGGGGARGLSARLSFFGTRERARLVHSFFGASAPVGPGATKSCPIG
jgi:hypothetical protein